MQTLSDNGIIPEINTHISSQANATISNLINPMFPKERIAGVLAKLIEANPFIPACYEIVRQQYGSASDGIAILEYFVK